MCFSAGASFGAGAVLSIIGTVAIMKARTIPQGLFAGIPLIFSIQQITEGMLWLSLSDPQFIAWRPFLTYTFLAFALVVWPLWIPFTIRKLEKDFNRKRILLLFLVAGFIAATAAGFVLIYYPVEVVLSDHHLHYNIAMPPAAKELISPYTILYLSPTILATFISSVNRMKWLGILFILSYTATLIFYSAAVVSIWC